MALSEACKDAGPGNDHLIGAIARDSPCTTGNTGNPSHRLPPEVLGSCFALLPLADCIRVSHVSRHWRAIALSTPTAWAHIKMDCDIPSQLEGLCTLLSRTGNVPVLMRFGATQPISEHAFSIAALPHIHHIRYLQMLHCRVDGAAPVNAPMLQYLLVHDTLEIPEGFLGERTRSLRSLSFTRGSLPHSCPSLSMLVALEVRELAKPAYAASFRGLFDICPRLEFLSLSGLWEEHDVFMPPGPAPPSLRTLFLSTCDEYYDLMPRYAAWKTSQLRHVMLDMGMTDTAHPISQEFLDGAVTLSVTLAHSCAVRWIVADFPDGRKHALGAAEYAVFRIGEFVATVHPALRDVHTLSISLDAVVPFSIFLADLPALKHLTVFVDWAKGFHNDGRVFTKEPVLEHLGRLADIPPLESLLVQMRISLSRPGRAPSRADADQLLSFLASLGPIAPSGIVIQGFTPDVLDGLDQGWLDKIGVRFDTDGMQEVDVRFDRANADRYWPFGYDI